jgi:hypothetical protein
MRVILPIRGAHPVRMGGCKFHKDDAILKNVIHKQTFGAG